MFLENEHQHCNLVPLNTNTYSQMRSNMVCITLSCKLYFPRLLESQSKLAEKLLFQKAPGATTKTAKTRKIDESYTHLSCGF